MLMALNAGCSGIATIHANSGRDALEKLVSYGILAGENISVPFLRRTVASVMDLVVFLTRRGGVRQVSEILSVPEQHDSDTFTTEFVYRSGVRPADPLRSGPMGGRRA